MPLRFVIALLAAALHVLFFVFESLLWTRPAVRARFRQTEEQAATTKLLAFNQGFYNLFLATGVVAGLWMALRERAGGELVVAWCCCSMLGAAIVLLLSSPKMLRGALIQGIPPLVYLALAASNL